jgi:Fur family transcriptional regulator, ferric uptake regulator
MRGSRLPEFSLQSVQVQATPLERFAEFLRSSGKRITQQRRWIVEQVFSHHDHFDADELMGHLTELISQRKLSRPTVYRTLGELVEAGLLRKMSLDGRSIFEHEYGYPNHDHLYCQLCNRLIEFHSDALEKLRDAVAQEHDFQVSSHRMFVTGVCSSCRRRKGGKSR